jgi:hypothetical protein
MFKVLSLYGKYFPLNYCMGLDSEKIRHEIRRNLRNGRSRSKKLADSVLKKVGSEKTVYREIKAMYESGEIRKIENNRADIEYELVDVTEAIENNFRIISKQLSEIHQRLENLSIKFENKQYLQRLYAIVSTIKQVQSLQTRIRLLSMDPAFERSKSFNGIKNKIDETWRLLLLLIEKQPEEQFFHEVMMNFPYTKIMEVTPLNKF